ncbi:MAG: hypothetical protein U9P70_02040 [Patescibacteria group bacterium]|nr:hypothetical protein [Patescibacteria group bacterium]
MINCFGGKAMEILENSAGENILAKYVASGKSQLIVGELKSVSRFRHVEIKTFSAVKIDLPGRTDKTIVSASLLRIPFIGMRIAIQEIKREGDDEIIYDNFLIPDDYNLANPAGVLELVKLFYGQAIQSG